MSQHHPDTPLAAQLEELRRKALELGADRAAVIDTGDISVSEAVAFKCRVPRCPNYASCAHCPPHAPTPEEFRRVLAGFSKAIIFNKRFAPEVMLEPEQEAARTEAFRSIFQIAAKLESAAFYAGRYLSFGLAAGSCRNVLCHEQKACAVLAGKACLFPALARPSMEAVGIDVFQLAALAGWDMQPLGREAKADRVEDSSLTGMVVVG